jgi:cytochrome c oxidase subunit II
MTRWEWLQATAAALGGAAAAVALARAADPAPRVVRITARRFAFEPRAVELKRGEAVLLELETLDREHGFDCPGLRLRADLAPGRVQRLRLQPTTPGRYGFICNVFCGEGHDDMDGEIIVMA